MSGPFDFAGLEAQGIANVQAVTDQQRKTAAFNALAHVYGPEAGDPELQSKLQANALATQLNPLKVQAANLENTGSDIKNKQDQLNLATSTSQANREAGYRLVQVLKNSIGADGAVDSATFDRVVTPQVADTLGIDQAHLAPLRALLTSPGGREHLDTIGNALLAPAPVTGASTVVQNPDGSYGMAGRNKYGQVGVQDLPQGTTPVLAAASQSRANSAAENANTGAYRANTTSNNSTFGNPDGTLPTANATPVPRVPQGASQDGTTNSVLTNGVPNRTLDKMVSDAGGIDQAIANTSSLPQPQQDRMTNALANRYSALHAAAHPQNVSQPASLFDKLPPKGRQQAIAQATQIANQGTNLKNINTILDQVDGQIAPFTAGAGSLLKDLPGTASTDLKANLETLKASGLMAWIASMKNAQGQTGIGRVLQSEAKAATALYGNMEQDQSAKQLAFHAKLFRTAVNQLYQHSNAAFKAQWGTTPQSALGINDDNSVNAGGAPNAKAGSVTTKPAYNYDAATGLLK